MKYVFTPSYNINKNELNKVNICDSKFRLFIIKQIEYLLYIFLIKNIYTYTL